MSNEQGGGFGGGGRGAPRGQAVASERTHVFVSHASEDAKLAQHFTDFITDLASNTIDVFNSSSKEPGQGIKYGEKWYEEILGAINKSKLVVALITPTSVDRPWILFEAGLGMAQKNCKVIGLSFGVKPADAYAGPFGALQNLGATEEELIKFAWEILESTTLKPREAVVKTFVNDFLTRIDSYAKSVSPVEESESKKDVAVFNALEEIRDLARSMKDISRSPMKYSSSRRVRSFLDILQKPWNPYTIPTALKFASDWSTEAGDFLLGTIFEEIRRGLDEGNPPRFDMAMDALRNYPRPEPSSRSQQELYAVIFHEFVPVLLDRMDEVLRWSKDSFA